MVAVHFSPGNDPKKFVVVCDLQQGSQFSETTRLPAPLPPNPIRSVNIMADENGDNPIQDGTPTQMEDSSGSGSGSDGEEEPVEWMVTARERRSTAGNRLSSLIQQEEADDELELLFAEADDDAGFEDAEADQSDVQMDSSDDDDDQGPAAGADELEGEKELQRQAKAEKAKKRRLNDGIPIFKKKVNVDPTTSQAPAPRPKKKSERASWIPTAEELPTRASQRGTTKLQKRALHAQMIDREYKRLKQLQKMEKAAAAKQAAKKPAMTQEDRLREAARVEKANSRSLSRWEQAEQEREEEQRAKLAALSNRHLEGPVLTWWSGLAQWAGGRLKQVGKTLLIEEPKEKPLTKKRKLAEMEAESEATQVDEPKEHEEAHLSMAASATAPDESKKDISPPPNPGTLPDRPEPSNQTPSPKTQPESIPHESGRIDSVPSPPLHQSDPSHPPSQNHDPPSGPLRPPPLYGHLQPTPSQSPLQAPLQPPTHSATPAQKPSHPPFILAPPQPWQPHLPLPPRAALDGSVPVPGLGYNSLTPQINQVMLTHTTPFAYSAPAPPAQPEVPPPPAHETTSRNLLILANFDDVHIRNKDVQTQILFGRKFLKASSAYLLSPPQVPRKTNVSQD